ncbi:GntR family transcriptional regulator [Herbaspirillum sp. LeCh32-8]|uniref:GntR family transcriptional regulator n=1 Tax=Herbaspirillum sp. LeCh32-8 TaxID=2821356 RepID=UPI001AE954AF|nr:GntR family transcriptional regulator [Herbaspirillum sp. LeCh32-8]MBP0598835.1 GntR family transcriptional regulator [Herbaspirillum sp. LeCh32-8]
MNPNEPLPLPEIVYRRLREAVLNGVYAPGTVLRQEEVAALLGVSRNPLREALPRLETEGLVILSPRRGYAVARLEADEIRDVFGLRILLETDLVRQAVAMRTEVDEQRLFKILEKSSDAMKGEDQASRIAWFDLNLQFHDALMLPANRPHQLKALSRSRGLLEAYIRMEVRVTGDLIQAQQEHEQLAEAFIRGDVDYLVDMTREHSEHTCKRLLAGLNAKHH